MSPLLGSTGGSSEYAFRGTLDDWPNPFATALAAQDPPTLIDPGIAITATLTITGLNYKARVIAEHPNATVAVTSEFGVAVTDGREVYAARKATDPPLLIRDQSVISIRLQPTSGTLDDFNKEYAVPVFIGKRTGVWKAKTRSIDQTPISFVFNPLVNQQLGIAATSNIIDIDGFESGFSFPISVTADQIGGNVSYFKNGVEFISPSTVVNGDRIYLSTLTPSLYSTPRTFTVQVGTFTTSWGILTRDPVTTIDPFTNVFTGIASANQLGFGYTSKFMTISGADIGPASADPSTWPTDPARIPVSISGGSFQILQSNNTPRYPAPPAPPPYWQTSPSFAFNGDKINVKVDSSGSYNTTTVGILTVSDKSGTFIVTTRPAPIDTIPQVLNDTFTDLSSQNRGSIIESNEITLIDMSPATETATASITAPGEFQVTRTPGGVVRAFGSANALVRDGDKIKLRVTTTNPDELNGSTTNNITFRVDGIDSSSNTATPTDNPEGFTTIPGSQSDTWTVTTVARNCTIIPPTNTDNTYGLGSVTGVQTNTSVSTNITFPSPTTNWNNDCRMRIRTNVGRFTAKNGSTISPGNTELANVLPTDTITLTITSSPDFETETLTTITLTNDTPADPFISPKDTKTVTWSVRTTANTSPATLNLSIASVPPSSSVEVGGTFILSWSSNNCTSIKDTQTQPSPPDRWTPAPTSLNGSVALVAPLTAGTYTYALRANVNSNASNVTDGTITTQEAGVFYITSNTITMTVTDDTSPVFTEPGNPANSNFTTQLDVAPTTDASFPVYYISNVLRVSSLSVKLSASIDTASDPGAAMIINGGTPSVSAVGTIGVGTDVQLRIAAAQVSTTDPTGYDTPTTATIRFFSGAVEVANKTFTARTRVCTPFESSIQFPTSPAPRAGDEASSITLDYYSGYSWTSTTSGTPITTTTEALLKNRVGTAASTASAYYRSTLTANGDPVPPALGAYNSRFADSQDTEVEWQELIDVIWNTHIELLQRPPTRNFIETAINGIVPSTYANLSSTKTFIVALIGTSAIRNTTTPIVNLPCRTTIKSGAYTLSGGNYV